MPWLLLATLARTLPVPVRRKRFLALDFVFSLGISFFLICLAIRQVEFQSDWACLWPKPLTRAGYTPVI
jgi:hypothetical protein